MRFRLQLTLLLIFILISGCSSFGRKLKELVGGTPPPPPQTIQEKQAQEVTTFSSADSADFGVVPRKYRRTTKKDFENDGLINGSPGSLWVMEGQGSYLFSQNMIRLVGDILKVKLSGEPRKQLITKYEVIKNLMNRLAMAKAKRKLASRGIQPKAELPEKKEVAKKTKDKEEESDFSVNIVPSRITNRLTDGNYRVKGAQTFMIGQREFRVIITGVVRPSDISDEVVDAGKILDAKFDIVSLKRNLRM